MKRYLPYLFVLGLLMVSCVRDVEIDLEYLPDRIVLNASVCPGKEVCAHLSKTWFIMDSVPDFELSDAKVRVYVNDEFQGLMRNDDLPEDSIHSRGQYVLPGCFVRQGDCLRIEAEADGYEPVSGETRIPGRARIYEVDTLSYRSSAYYAEYLRFSVKIGVETDSYYRLIVEQILDFRKGDSTRTVTSFRSLGGYSWYYSGFSVDLAFRNSSPFPLLCCELLVFAPQGLRSSNPAGQHLSKRKGLLSVCAGNHQTKNLSSVSYG